VAGPYPLLFTDECIDGPIVQALTRRGWDVEHATEVFGGRTNDSHLFEHAAARGRVFVTTDQDHLATADE
jgi:predicted nuclease of predicted toxin-antitoxin system